MKRIIMLEKLDDEIEKQLVDAFDRADIEFEVDKVAKAVIIHGDNDKLAAAKRALLNAGVSML